jgi:hypothetical protein
MAITVSAETRSSGLSTAFLFQYAIRAISAGRVQTTWTYSTGSRSSARTAIQSRAAGPWQLGQCRFLQELWAMWWWPHLAQPPTFLGKLAEEDLDHGLERRREHPTPTLPGNLGERFLDRTEETGRC